MMLATTLLIAGALTGADVRTEADVPSVYVSGQPFHVEVRYAVGAEGGELEAWRAGRKVVAREKT